jgi:calreticulin
VLAAGWDKRWQKSSWKESDGSAGKFTQTAGKWYGDEEADKGIQTGPDSKYFALYSELKKAYTNEGKELIVQVSSRGGSAVAAVYPAFGVLQSCSNMLGT